MSDPTMSVCPRCETDFSVDGVKSKRDNRYIICKGCGLEECMIDWFELKRKESDIPVESIERELKFNKLVHSDEKNS